MLVDLAYECSQSRTWSASEISDPSPSSVLTTCLPAQTPTGAITGIVADPTQAAVAGASVIVTNLATGGIVRTQTNSSGVYNAPSLPIGTYELRVGTPGFKTYIGQNIVIEVTRLVRVDVTLQLGDLQEKLTVQAQAPLLEPETSSIGTAVHRVRVSHGFLVHLPTHAYSERRVVTGSIFEAWRAGR